MTFDDRTTILGPSHVSHRQAVDTFMAKRGTKTNGYTRLDLNAIFKSYAERCAATGVSFGVAVAQVAHETGWLTSWWSARPRRNPAGLAVTGATYATQPKGPAAFDDRTNIWRAGLSFATWDDAVVGHVGRLLGYVLPVGAGNPAQRAVMDRALALRPLPSTVRGCATVLSDLNGRWAVPGTTYGAAIAARLTSMAAA